MIKKFDSRSLVLTTAAHSLNFFFTPEGANDTERKLINLMNTYKTDMGGGFAPSNKLQDSHLIFSNLRLQFSATIN